MPRPKKSRPKTHDRKWYEGTVREIRPGVWRAWRARQTTPDGKTHRPTKTFSGAGAEDRAKAWAKGDPEPEVMYLGQWLERWIALRAPSLDPSTLDHYQRDMTACDDLLLWPIADITTDDWQGRANALLKRWSRYHVFIWKGNISVALRAAMARGYLAENTILGITLPKPDEQQPKAWRQAEVDRMLASAEGRSHEAWLLFVLGTGVRLGESRALRRDDLDLVSMTATIRASLDNSTSERGPTKTRRIRVIDVPEEVVAVLAEHLKRLPTGQDLLFGHGDRAYRARTYRSWLATVCHRAGIPTLPPHSLRHTYASLAFDARVPVQDVAKQLGHTVETCQRIYAHFIGDDLRRSANAVGAALRHRFSGPKPTMARGMARASAPDQE